MKTMALTLNRGNKIEILNNKVRHSNSVESLSKTIYDSYLELQKDNSKAPSSRENMLNNNLINNGQHA